MAEEFMNQTIEIDCPTCGNKNKMTRGEYYNKYLLKDYNLDNENGGDGVFVGKNQFVKHTPMAARDWEMVIAGFAIACIIFTIIGYLN
ncbi:MAG: hypothetical protein WCW16_03030 [Candidatus Magasanikbacteria bacterium]